MQGTLVRVNGEKASRAVSVPELLEYFDDVAGDAAKLPAYYPDRLSTSETGKTCFDNIRQKVQVIEDRAAFERWAKERERMRAAGQGFDRTPYQPMRARPEVEEPEAMRRDLPAPPSAVVWNEKVGERFKRAIVLGDPGFGKTWLLRYEARHLANEAARQLREHTGCIDELTLPIFARLWEVNRKDIPFEDELVELVVGNRSNGFRRFVQDKLKSERCVIMLDAWDEVWVEVPKAGQPLGYEQGSQQLLGERLKTFAEHFPLPRMLLTSRIAGYESSHLSIPNLQELELLAFDSPQTESFVSVWFGDDTQAANHCLALLRQIPQVRGLARIPLMLTLLCRTYVEYQQNQREFPTQRVELYERCLRGLLRDWKKEKEQREISDGYVDAVLELLQPVSYALFVEGYEQFSESDLRKKIIKALDRLKVGHELYGRTPTSIIAELKRDGVLITAFENSGAPLLFAHSTLQEYLTARTFAEIVNEKGWQAEVELHGKMVTMRQLVDKKAWDPRWQEVIVLLAGRLRNPEPQLRLLTDKKRDDMFCHRLALAALCLPEIKALHGTGQLSQLIDRITTDVFLLWWNHVTKSVMNSPAPLDHVLPALGQVNGRVNGTPMLEWIRHKLRTGENDETRFATKALASIGSAAATKDILDQLTQLLQSPNLYVRYRAAQAIASIGAVVPDFHDPIAQMLQDWVNADEAAETIEEIGSAAATPTVLDQLVKLLRSGDPLLEQVAAFQAVEAIGSTAGSRIFLDQLAEMLQDSNRYVRQAATEAIAGIGSAAATPVILHRLTYLLLQGDKDEDLEYDEGYWCMRDYVARAIASIGSAAVSPVLLDGLAEMLRSPADPIWRAGVLAVEGIGGAAAAKDILDQLARLLRSTGYGAQERVIQAVSEIGPAAATPPILNQLEYLRQNSAEYMRPRVEQAIASIGTVEVIPDFLERLAQMLENPDYSVRIAAAEAVARIGSTAATKEILDRLAQMLRRSMGWSQSSLTWEAAVRAVSKLGNAAATKDILYQLTQLLQNPAYNTRAEEEKVLEAMRQSGAYFFVTREGIRPKWMAELSAV